MSDEKLTFFEMRNIEIERLTILLDNHITDQKKYYQVLANQTNRSDFIATSTLLFINQRNKTIEDILNIIRKLREFDTIKWVGSKIKKLPNGELSDKKIRTDFDLKTDGVWMEKAQCTKKQLEDISNAFYRLDKNLFFRTLFEITKNQSLTHRYTKHFFKSSIKHKSKSSLLES